MLNLFTNTECSSILAVHFASFADLVFCVIS